MKTYLLNVTGYLEVKATSLEDAVMKVRAMGDQRKVVRLMCGQCDEQILNGESVEQAIERNGGSDYLSA